MVSVLSIGAVPPGPCGVSDYGRLLSEELRHRGYKVDERWVVNRGLRLRDAGLAAVELLRIARAVPRDSVVLWHYSSFPYTLRGIPLPGVFFGLVLRQRRVCVVSVLHEPAYGFGRRGWKGSIQALTQQLALPAVLAGSDEVVVTTSRRARVLRLVPPPLRRPVHCVPVFSTLGSGQEQERHAGVPPTLGIPSWTSDGVRPELLLKALKLLPPTIAPRLRLLGCADATSAMAGVWRTMAERAELGERIDFTGIVSAEELSRHLDSCNLVVFVNGEGPSSRKTTLAAALAHAMPIVALDGREGWSELCDARAVEIVAQQPAAVASAICRLLSDGRERRELAARARAFYDAHMTLAEVAGQLETILAGATAGRTGAAPTGGGGCDATGRVDNAQRFT